MSTFESKHPRATDGTFTTKSHSESDMGLDAGVPRQRPSRSKEDRQAEAQRLHESIAEQVEQLRDSDRWKEYMDFASKFHQYSFTNTLLIYAQNPGATHVAGYKTWNKLGRQVRKGEKGLRILAGRRYTVGDDKDEDEDEKKNSRRSGMVFFATSVFDISQTEKIDPDSPDAPELARRLTGADEAQLYGRVENFLSEQGWTVSRKPIAGAINGYTTIDGSKRIVVDQTLSDAQAAKTLTHEAAHALLHANEAPGEHHGHRGVKETEAESVAYVVASMNGMDTSDYSIGYVAGWSGLDSTLIKSTASNVLKAVHQIMDGLDKQLPGTAD